MERVMFSTCIYSTFFGYFPARIVGAKYRVSLVLLAISVFQIVITFTHWFMSFAKINNNKNQTVKVLFHLYTTCSHIFLPVNVLWTVFSVKHLNDLFYKFALINRKLKLLGIEGGDVISHRFLILELLLSCIILSWAVFPVFLGIGWFTPLELVYYYYPVFPLISVVHQISSIVSLIRHKLVQMNKVMEKKRFRYDPRIINFPSVYEDLWKVSEDISSLFSLQILNIVLSVLANIITHAYLGSYLTSVNTGLMTRLMFINFYWGWVVLYTLIIVGLASSCNKVYQKVSE